MNHIVRLFTVSIVFFMFSCGDTDNTGIMVVFPEVEGPVQITDGSREHFFASYYGINSFDRTERYVTVLETDIKYKLPDENEPATLGLVDLTTNTFIPLTQTRAWNFQQGCMAHWLGTSPDSLIIYNDFRDGIYVSVIMNVHTRKEIKTLPYPVSAVSHDGKKALSINFSRLRLTRPDYGYGGGGQDPRKDNPLPYDDGLFIIDLETGVSKLLVSFQDVKELIPPVAEGSIAWFNHTLFSREGSKIFWLSRQMDQRTRITTSLTVNTDGTNLRRCFPDNWGGSHYDWLNDDELMVTASWEAKQYAHVLFTVGEQNYRRLGNGILDYDGHGTFSPDQRWMITDTYPGGGMREQKIYLMDMKTEAVLPLGRYVQPSEYTNHWRCDIHCRWSPGGKMVGFNSTHTGSRQAYIFRFN
ncbi:MAG: hypothetical protein JXR66_01350 [Bacteroidales bacterium]|nr:hypothetical protein [Bacteroidales bacterium]MBN2632171.1 hypothetical protein [Bacteroidales bacterium]